MARNWDSISNIFLKISFLSDKSGTHVLMVFVLFNIVASLHTITIFFIPPSVCMEKGGESGFSGIKLWLQTIAKVRAQRIWIPNTYPTSIELLF